MSLDPHIWPDTAEVIGGRLQIGGCDVADLAADHATPLYVLDEATLRGSMRAYRAAMARRYPGPSRVHYASKALLNTAVAQIVAEEGLGLDVVSGAELLVARRAGMPMDQVHMHGNAKGEAELRRAVEWGVGAIVVDSLDELDHLAALTHGLERPQGVLLRVAPNIDAHTHAHIATGGAASKFGLPLEAVGAAAARVLDADGLRLLGLHAHIGSQLFAAGEICAAVAVLAREMARLRDTLGVDLEELSPGGGLGVPYTADMPPT
ncbi:MAG: diaminopimelate decarboxylase, partial [Chloroflexales bacterium]